MTNNGNEDANPVQNMMDRIFAQQDGDRPHPKGTCPDCGIDHDNLPAREEAAQLSLMAERSILARAREDKEFRTYLIETFRRQRTMLSALICSVGKERGDMPEEELIMAGIELGLYLGLVWNQPKSSTSNQLALADALDIAISSFQSLANQLRGSNAESPEDSVP